MAEDSESFQNPVAILDKKAEEEDYGEERAAPVEVEPLRSSISWADGAPHVRGGTDCTETAAELPLNEKFEDEGSRSAAVTDEALLDQLTTSTANTTTTAAEVRQDPSCDNIANFADSQSSSPDTVLDITDDKEEESTSSMTGITEDKASSVVAVQVADAEDATKKVDNKGIEDSESNPQDNIILPPSMSEEMIQERTKAAYEASASPEAASQLLSLPIDSLHCIASFLTPMEWANYGQTCVNANKVCREIFRRVRMHGFRCATEVITAWKLGQHADAKELAALYISAGVPIYPYSLGHSYHTVCWRLGVEAKDMQDKSDGASDGAGANSTEQRLGEDGETIPPSQGPTVDRFYTDRLTGFRGQDATIPLGSYLEEKCLYWVGPVASPDSPLTGRWNSLTYPPTPRERPLVPPVAAVGGDPVLQQQRQPDFRAMVAGSNPPSPLSATSSPRRPGLRSSQSDLNSLASGSASKVPRKTICIHRHLLDQHLLGRSSVDDEEGTMMTPPTSLAADFYHPHLGPQNISARSKVLMQPLPLSPYSARPHERVSNETSFEAWAERATALHNRRVAGGSEEDEEELAELRELYSQIFATDRMSAAAANAFATDRMSASANTTAERIRNEVGAAEPAHVLPPSPASPQNFLAEDSFLSGASSTYGGKSFWNNVDLEVYSATSVNHKGVPGAGEIKRLLNARFMFYQRRLEVLLHHGDSSGYEECMLDLWDEFLPLTANIHYFDRHTAVPRITNLQQFLTQPCPKAVGIVQCEIERIRICSKKRKGVGMKSRLFPTYEYRLFIRDREHGASNSNAAENTAESEEETGIRRDTVLMVAKNRGRNHVDTSGVVSMTPASKKGANNYYLYTPQQGDIDTHFNEVNSNEEETWGNLNGVSLTKPGTNEKARPVMLGRLQSNFIGTEFQIYSPRVRKGPSGKIPRRCASLGDSPSSLGEDLDCDSGAISDTGATGRRRSRFGRLTLRRHSSHASAGSPTNDQTSPLSTRSRTTRMNRRAIANTVETSPSEESEDQLCQQPVLCEEEDGVITYTANLLGSRPRIMDVCIPKVPPDGTSTSIWRQFLDNSEDFDDCASYNRMLNCFKQLQQRLETQNADDDGGNAQTANVPEDFGLLALQNRPPWWNIELGSFVLNFRGRVSVASVKNFQLCDRNDHDNIMLQFGRIQGRHSFTMDYQYPLTAVQAFSIAISSLQSKISFG